MHVCVFTPFGPMLGPFGIIWSTMAHRSSAQQSHVFAHISRARPVSIYRTDLSKICRQRATLEIYFISVSQSPAFRELCVTPSFLHIIIIASIVTVIPIIIIIVMAILLP